MGGLEPKCIFFYCLGSLVFAWSSYAKISRTHSSSQFTPSTPEPPPNCFLVFQVPLPSPAEMLMKCECTRMGLLGNLTGLLPSPCSLIKLLLRGRKRLCLV